MRAAIWRVSPSIARHKFLEKVSSSDLLDRLSCDEAFGRATSHAGAHLASIEFGQFESSTLCGMAATIRAPGHEQRDGNTLWLEYNPAVDTWMCSSSVEDRYLPHSCRG